MVQLYQQQHTDMDEKIWEISKNEQRAQKIEKSTERLQELWLEVERIVDLNQAKIDSITTCIENTKDYVITSVKTMENAQDYQEKAANARFYTMIAVVAFMIIIVLVIVCMIFQ